MEPKTYKWISAWFLLTVPVIVWDAFYCLLRPRSMVGGDLHWIWKPYAIYQEVDYVYGVKALQENNGFTSAQSVMNLIETALNVFYLYLAHVVKYPAASVVGFASVTMTLSKTALYWLQEYYCNFCAVGHNDLKTLVVYFIIPNGLWIVIPALIVVKLGKDITSLINVAARESKKKTTSAICSELFVAIVVIFISLKRPRLRGITKTTTGLANSRKSRRKDVGPEVPVGGAR